MNEEKKLYSLEFDPEIYVTKTIEVEGAVVTYRAYEHIVYVENPVDLNFHSLNIYVPESAVGRKDIPIFFRNYVGGYMSTPPVEPSTTHKFLGTALAYALYKGYVAVSPGARGREDKAGGLYSGKAPADIVDMKAAIRYLRHNSDVIPGNVSRILSDGSSAGGAMSALLGTTGNNADYEPYLRAIGAAEERDDVYAAVCFCPIIDLEHSNAAYEWMFGNVTEFRMMKPRPVGNELVFDPIDIAMAEEDKLLSRKFADIFSDYQNSLGLKDPETGEPLTLEKGADKGSYLNYLLRVLGRSATEYMTSLNADDRERHLAERPWLDFDPQTGIAAIAPKSFRSFIEHVSRCKSCPSFDGFDLEIAENSLFGTETVHANHFDDSLEAVSGNTGKYAVPAGIRKEIALMNPTRHVNEGGNTMAPYFYIRVGALDSDHSYSASMNLAIALNNSGKCEDINYKIVWPFGHDGDYNMYEMFEWFRDICQETSPG